MHRITLLKRVCIFSLLITAFSNFCTAAENTQPTPPIDPMIEQSTRAMVNELLNQLGQRLKSTLSSEGAEAAISVCKEASPSIAKRLSLEHGVAMTRVGTRTRNPAMGTPNVWQQNALTEFETRLSAGENPTNLEYWKIVENAEGRRELRYAKAIITQPMCLGCHGNVSDIPASLAEKIRLEYPKDQATGYSVGKLRGAVVVTRPSP